MRVEQEQRVVARDILLVVHGVDGDPHRVLEAERHTARTTSCHGTARRRLDRLLPSTVSVAGTSMSVLLNAISSRSQSSFSNVRNSVRNVSRIVEGCRRVGRMLELGATRGPGSRRRHEGATASTAAAIESAFLGVRARPAPFARVEPPVLVRVEFVSRSLRLAHCRRQSPCRPGRESDCAARPFRRTGLRAGLRPIRWRSIGRGARGLRERCAQQGSDCRQSNGCRRAHGRPVPSTASIELCLERSVKAGGLPRTGRPADRCGTNASRAPVACRPARTRAARRRTSSAAPGCRRTPRSSTACACRP